MCLTTHAQATNAARKAVVNKLEFLLPTAINKCLENGAKPTNILHLYLAEEGMDFTFAFNPAEKHFFLANKEEFLNKSCSVIVIKDTKTMICFRKAFVFGLAHLAENQLMFENYRSHNAKQWNKTAIKVYKILGLDLQHSIAWKQMEVASDLLNVNIYLFDSSIYIWIQ